MHAYTHTLDLKFLCSNSKTRMTARVHAQTRTHTCVRARTHFIVLWANSEPMILGCERVNSGHDPSIAVGHRSIIQQAAIQFHQLPTPLPAVACRGKYTQRQTHKLNWHVLVLNYTPHQAQTGPIKMHRFHHKLMQTTTANFII